MVKIVKSGCRDCTVTLDGTECAVEFPANYRVFSAMNMSDSDIIMSVESGKTAADDGVRIVEAGGVGALNHMRSDINTLYITGTGKVQISAGNEAVLPFRSAAKGGDTVSASGNPVQLSGLQGGVPFAEIKVCGEDIIGQDLTLMVSGKNFLKNSDFTNPLNSKGQTEYSSTESSKVNTIDNWYSWLILGKKIIVGENCITLYRDVSTTANRTDIRQNLNSFIPIIQGQEITVSANYRELSINSKSQMFVRVDEGSGLDDIALIDLSNSGYTEKTVKIPKNIINFEFGIWTLEALDIYNAQIEIGRSATEFEAYRDTASYSITPDSNPYTIPNDIRQQEGLNNISVSAGELSVVGVRKNAAIKRIYDDFSLELLFDGLARADSPAVGVDFSQHSKFIVSNYLNTLSSKCDYAGTVLIERDRLESLISNASFLDVPISTQYSVVNYFSGTISSASFYAVQSMDSSALYATRIYGIR